MIEKIVKYLKWQNAIFVSLFIIILIISAHQLYFNTTRYLYILVFTLIIWLLIKKCFHLINNINKFTLLLFAYLCFLQGYSIVEMLYPYPTIINSESYNKAMKISESIINYPINREFHLDKDTTSIVLHTDNSKIFDKIAIAIADSDLFDNSVKIGVYYKYSDNSQIAKKRAEKSFNKRIELIGGVKSAKTNIMDKDNITINVVIDKNADKDRIYKIIRNFLPIPDENKKIIIQNE